MAVFIVLWPYLLTTKLRCLQRKNIGHTTLPVRKSCPSNFGKQMGTIFRYSSSSSSIKSKSFLTCTRAMSFHNLSLLLKNCGCIEKDSTSRSWWTNHSWSLRRSHSPHLTRIWSGSKSLEYQWFIPWLYVLGFS